MKQLRNMVGPYWVTATFVAPVASRSISSLAASWAIGMVTAEKKEPTTASGSSDFRRLYALTACFASLASSATLPPLTISILYSASELLISSTAISIAFWAPVPYTAEPPVMAHTAPTLITWSSPSAPSVSPANAAGESPIVAAMVILQDTAASFFSLLTICYPPFSGPPVLVSGSI